jgi:ribosomal protein L37E
MPLSKWSRRHRRTFGDKKPEPEVFLEHHRVPPKPTNYYTEKKGECRFCGFPIKNDQGEINTRKSWHSHCADEYMLMYHPGEARKRLWQRDRGYCAGCGIVQPRKSRVHEEKWHVDHIKPLWEQKGKRFDEIDLDYWREDNLQTLCTECHTKKTSREAAERAKLKKEDK